MVLYPSGDLESYILLFVEKENGGRRNQKNSHNFRVKIDLPFFNIHLHVESFLEWLLEMDNLFDYM